MLSGVAVQEDLRLSPPPVRGVDQTGKIWLTIFPVCSMMYGHYRKDGKLYANQPY